MVYFGTGKFFESADNIVAATPALQTFYGLWDKGDGTSIASSSNLIEQTIDDEQSQTFTDNSTTPSTTTKYSLRLTSNNTVDYSASGVRGWFMTLKSPISGGQGERVVSVPQLRAGKIIFVTLIPSTNSCSGGGSSWFMDLDALSGGAGSTVVFDFNNDQKFTTADKLNGKVISAFQTDGISSAPVIISNGASDRALWSTTAGKTSGIGMSSGSGSGRQSWRQLQ